MKKDKLTVAIFVCSIAIIILVSILVFLNINKKGTQKTKLQPEVKEKQLAQLEKDSTKQSLFVDQTPAKTETEVINYIEQVGQDAAKLTYQEPTTPIKEKLTTTFISLTDFIFYGGTIKGTTFSQLSNTSKDKVLNTLNLLDSKIENVVPKYKETITQTTTKSYQTVTEKVKSLKDSIVNSYKQKVGTEQYNQVVQNYQKDKTSAKKAYTPVVDKGKQVYEKTKDKGKEIYDSITEKSSSWYQQFKESRK